MKKSFPIIIILTASLLLSACGSMQNLNRVAENFDIDSSMSAKSYSTGMSNAELTAPPMAMSAAGVSQSYDSSTTINPDATLISQDNEALKNRKFIRTIDITLSTDDSDGIESTLNTFKTEAEALGGYSETTTIDNSEYSTYGRITIRIPDANADAFIHLLEKENLKCESKNDSVEDVTLQYSDLDSRLKVLNEQKAKYMEYLTKAENVSETMEIEQQLSDVLYQIDTYQSQMNVLKNQISYTTISIRLEYIKHDSQSFGGKLAEAFGNMKDHFGDTIVNCVELAGYVIPFLLFWSIIGFAAFKLIKHVIKLLKKRKQKNQKKSSD